jgi:hypothetical protein
MKFLRRYLDEKSPTLKNFAEGRCGAGAASALLRAISDTPL